jgi:hypothetical protein
MPDELKRPFDLSNLLPTTYLLRTDSSRDWSPLFLFKRKPFLVGFVTRVPINLILVALFCRPEQVLLALDQDDREAGPADRCGRK